MSESVSLIQPRRLRAPREDGHALIDPAPIDGIAWIARNIQTRRLQQADLGGHALADLAAEARTRMLAAAIGYTAEYRDVSSCRVADKQAPVVMVGHQPELVHPGVWFKNFVLSELARRVDGVAVHLLCDNDHVRATSLRVPTGPVARPRLVSIPFDQAGHMVAYEHRMVQDHDLFRAFGRRVAETIEPLVHDPLIRAWWPSAVEAMEAGAPLGAAVARARHVLEGRWGLNTLEVPLGQLCGQMPFQYLAAHLLHHCAWFLQVHNDCLAAYRQVNRVRSHAHPVPDLAQLGEAIETPFWLWTRDDLIRRPAWINRPGRNAELTDRHSVVIPLGLDPDGDLESTVQRLQNAERQGIYLRPRALMTTMFARLLLSDLFIHGIGGAKYDELTDALVRRFFGIEPPAFLVATLTAMLPIHRQDVVPADLRRIDDLLRELRYHPECHVDVLPETERLIERKRNLVNAAPPTMDRRQRHQELEQVNANLRRFLEMRRDGLLRQRRDLQVALRSTAILASREYAFCLFPERNLRPRLLDLARGEP